MCAVQGLWVGWAGDTQGEAVTIPEADPQDSSPTAGLRSGQVRAVQLSAAEHALYYNGCCNATLWPLFHSMPDRAVFEDTYWSAYTSVNTRFAAETLLALEQRLREEPDTVPVVWIHDYHLMLAANTIRCSSPPPSTSRRTTLGKLPKRKTFLARSASSCTSRSPPGT